MTTSTEEKSNRWITKRNAQLDFDISQGVITLTEAKREFDLSTFDIEEWVEHRY
jgi:hypothetical protein